MNELFNNNIHNIANTNKNISKAKKLNVFTMFSNIGSNQNRFLSENQRNLTNFNSQKKMKKKENAKSNPINESKNSDPILVSFSGNNFNNIKIKNYSNLISKATKVIKSKNKSHCLSKPKLEIEINNRNNSNNISTNYSKITKNKKYKKNISEHDLVNNIINTFSNYNYQKGVNIKLNFSSKKKLNTDKNNKNKTKTKSSVGTTTEANKSKQTKSRHASDTKLLRSSSGYSYINSKLAQTNSFFSGNNSNKMGYISTYGNNPDWTNSNFENIMKVSAQKNNNCKKNKNSKSPIIGKIIKNYKNNDLNCIFNMNLMPPVTPLSNIQDYFKHLYKIEYNSESKENRAKKTNRKNKKDNDNNNEYRGKEEKGRDKDRDLRTKNNDDYSQSKNTMTKTNDISKIKREKDSIDNQKYCSDSPEEIHFYVITSIQNGKNMECNLIRK